MLTAEEIQQAHDDWKAVELADLSSANGHLQRERERWYLKWGAKLLDHARGVERAPWEEGL